MRVWLLRVFPAWSLAAGIVYHPALAQSQGAETTPPQAPVHGDEPSTPVAAETATKQEAKRLMQLGVKAYQANDYRRALEHYRQSYALDSNPALLYAIAQTHRAQGDCTAAIAAYEEFLKSRPAPSAQRAARTNRDRCAENLRQSPTAAPQSAASPASDTPSGTTPSNIVPPSPVPPSSVPPHMARPALTAPRQSTAPRPAASAGSPSPDATMSPAPHPAPPSLLAPSNNGTSEPDWYLDSWGAAASLSGTVLLSVGGGLLVAASLKEDDTTQRAADPSDDDSLQDHVNSIKQSDELRTAGWLGVVAGSGLLAAGITRYIWLSEQQATTELSVTVVPGYTGARWRGAF